MTAQTSDALISHMQHVLLYHEALLSDKVRNAAFHRTLKKHVNARTTVLDIGTGTGIWAMAAAKLGAKRIVAVEKERLLIPIIQKLLKQNRVEDRVEVLEGDSREIDIEGKFDVLISETIGNEVFDEEIIPIMLDARQRFLKRGGVTIPQSISALLVPASLKSRCPTLPAGVALDFSYLEQLNADVPKRVNDRSQLKMLGIPRLLAKADLAHGKTSADLGELKASWSLKDGSQLNCLVIWAEVVMTPGVKLSTIESPSWTPIAFPVEALEPGPAKIQCTLTLTDKKYYWKVDVRQNGRQQTQSHSPIFPYTVLSSQLGSR